MTQPTDVNSGQHGQPTLLMPRIAPKGADQCAGAGQWCPACTCACMDASAEDTGLWQMRLGRGIATLLMDAFHEEVRASSDGDVK